jgi:putative zinc finger/helix-turn-helix YgiT family protein
MNCMDCGSEMKSGIEDVPYALDLPYGITLHGVVVHRCLGCEEYEVEIPRVDALHRAIALQVARREGRLAPKEVRFLRKSLGWSGRNFAARIQVQPETVSRWENGVKKMGERSELLLRMFVELGKQIEDYALLEGTPPPAGLTMVPDETVGWSVAA